MDGSHYDFGKDAPTAVVPLWRRQLSAMRGAILMLAVAVATFVAIVALDSTGVQMPGDTPTLTQGALQ